jgi:hypothetical protein
MGGPAPKAIPVERRIANPPHRSFFMINYPSCSLLHSPKEM